MSALEGLDMETEATSGRGSFRHWKKLILIPALTATLTGYLVSYAFSAQYTSQSLVLVEAPKIPDAVVQQVFTEDLTEHIDAIEQQVKSQSRLRPMVERLGLVKGNQNVDDVIDTIQLNMTIEPVVTDLSQIGAGGRSGSSVPAFSVNYTASTAKEAQQICTELTSMVIEQDLKSRQETTHNTVAFLTQQVAEATQNIDEMDRKLAAFKNQHMGQLPSDEDNNLKILMGLNSQLDDNTQTLNRATQDKAYTESILAEQVATWEKSQPSSDRQTLQQQLIDLQAQLIDLQAHHTDEGPDGIKTKTDIAQVKKHLAEISDAPNDKQFSSDPPEIRQLRLQIHQYQDLVAQATRDSKKLQQEISVYQSRVASSPGIEEEYKELARDYDNAQKVYQDDLAKLSVSKMATQAEQQGLGEQMVLLNPASLPDSDWPSFPNRFFFAVGGLVAGLACGVGLAFWLGYRPNLLILRDSRSTVAVSH
jgi:uncharacterized protein involved in exopolysaccharide biosynthesis